jgi:hypothetical protein
MYTIKREVLFAPPARPAWLKNPLSDPTQYTESSLRFLEIRLMLQEYRQVNPTGGVLSAGTAALFFI